MDCIMTDLPPLPWGDDFEAWLEVRNEHEVAQAVHEYAKRAVEAEREQCAKVCDDIATEYEGEDVLATWCAAAIRARGNA